MVLGLAALGAGLIAGSGAALARGGAANIMDSPGYQRALQESRKRQQQQPGPSMAQPFAAPPVAYPHPERRVGPKRRHRAPRH
ncbi:hypothetical protein OR798_09760 [Rhodopseudomonas palustris]|nr:hypothetical protein [Rhodopseudomonas palustris]WAB80121.1 hypothetical protein OR798_09760 [Rhodopseudomonas palustris]WCL92043.1 hypothetical protein TX73_009755 [Rhodopseudomonas palustris CGA009]WND54017.1 hypothetical protein L1A21_09725 [Rhodopseudomonas palustris]